MSHHFVDGVAQRTRCSKNYPATGTLGSGQKGAMMKCKDTLTQTVRGHDLGTWGYICQDRNLWFGNANDM